MPESIIAFFRALFENQPDCDAVFSEEIQAEYEGILLEAERERLEMLFNNSSDMEGSNGKS